MNLSVDLSCVLPGACVLRQRASETRGCLVTLQKFSAFMTRRRARMKALEKSERLRGES